MWSILCKAYVPRVSRVVHCLFVPLSQISALLRKSTTKLEKISYLMPCDVHRLIDSEAMVVYSTRQICIYMFSVVFSFVKNPCFPQMINQALLANRRALAKLCLNLMEKHLQMDIFQRLRWEEKLQDWKQLKLNDAVTRFRQV